MKDKKQRAFFQNCSTFIESMEVCKNILVAFCPGQRRIRTIEIMSTGGGGGRG